MHKLLLPPTSPLTSVITTKRTSLSSSTERDQISITFNSSTTPANSPPTPLCHLSSAELLSPPRVSSPKSHISSPYPSSTRSLDNKDHDDDELLLFTPVKSLSVDRPSSPLNPSTPKSPCSPLFPSDTVDRDIHNLSQSPFQDFLALSISPESSSQALHRPEEFLELPEVIQEQVLDGPRYPLRRRKAAQLKPYTVDQLKYKQALRANPEAIVKFKNLALRNHLEDRYEEDEETQKDAYIDDGNDADDDWEARKSRRHHQRCEGINDGQCSIRNHSLSERQPISYPEILRDLSSTDEEEASEKHTLSKEAQKIVKERERQRKIQAKEERRREQELRPQQLLKRNPFPTLNHTVSNVEAPPDDNDPLEDVCHFYANISVVI